MKIIEVGAKPEDKVYRCTCTHCKTVFEFVRSEATYQSDQRDGDFLKIGCPVCAREVYKSA